MKDSIDDTERPWMSYYLTVDELLDIVRVAYNDTYGPSDHRWHPEDLYVNVSVVLETVTNTLSNMVRLKSGRPLQGVKDQ